MADAAGGAEPKQWGSMLDWALLYAGQGFKVFPLHEMVGTGCSCKLGGDCERKAKHPRTTHGLNDASVDVKQIREWWGDWPTANVGITTGPVSDFWALDIDAKPSPDGRTGYENLKRLTERFGPLPKTTEVKTGGGGLHLFFKLPKDRKVKTDNNGIKDHGCIDVRGTGGYVVAAPARHENGNVYSWNVPFDKLRDTMVDAPEWLLSLVCEVPKTTTTPPPTAGPTSSTAGSGTIPEGQRDKTLTSLAGTMRRRGMSESAIFAALVVVNQEQCIPQVSDADLRRISHSIAKHPPSAVPYDVVDTTPRVVPGQYVHFKGRSKVRPPPVDYLVYLLVEAGKVTNIVGAPDVGKGTVAMWLMACHAIGVDFFGFPTKSGSSLMITLEESDHDLWRKVYAWQDRHPLLNWEKVEERLHCLCAAGENMSLIQPMQMSKMFQVDEAAISAIADRIYEIDPLIDLIVLDTTLHFTGGEMSNEAYMRFNSACRCLANEVEKRSGILPAVMPIAHTTKTAGKDATGKAGDAIGGVSFFGQARGQLQVEEIGKTLAKAYGLEGKTPRELSELVLLTRAKGNVGPKNKAKVLLRKFGGEDKEAMTFDVEPWPHGDPASRGDWKPSEQARRLCEAIRDQLTKKTMKKVTPTAMEPFCKHIASTKGSLGPVFLTALNLNWLAVDTNTKVSGNGVAYLPGPKWDDAFKATDVDDAQEYGTTPAGDGGVDF